MLGLAVYVKEELRLHSSYLKKAPRILIYVFDWLQFIQFLPFFTLSFNNFVLFIVFNAIASNIDEFLSINPFANVFVFGDLNVHYKDWLTYCQTTLPGWLAFLLGSLSVNLSTLFQMSFFFLILVFDPSNSKGMFLFITWLMTIHVLLGMVSVIV